MPLFLARPRQPDCLGPCRRQGGIDRYVVLAIRRRRSTFEGAHDRSSPALGLTLRDELVEELHDFVRQADCDLRRHTKMVPVRDGW